MHLCEQSKYHLSCTPWKSSAVSVASFEPTPVNYTSSVIWTTDNNLRFHSSKYMFRNSVLCNRNSAPVPWFCSPPCLDLQAIRKHSYYHRDYEPCLFHHLARHSYHLHLYHWDSSANRVSPMRVHNKISIIDHRIIFLFKCIPHHR